MCGIAGFFALDGQPASPVVLRRMTDAVAHRGPDGEGVYTDGALGFGHRRLAIIDLSPAGHQPMQSSDGRYVITYNGEVYNFQELRVELEALGWPFHSRTDTEVLLHAYAQWGPRAVERFNGMFALAIWDRQERRLFLARDRYGIKPLYYAWAGRTFVFGSEVKSLLEHPGMDAALDQEALVEYLTFQNYVTPRTLFAGVRLLPAGTHLTLTAGDGDAPAPVQYWDFDFREPETPGDDREYAEELDRLFRQAVRRQLVSDVDVGAYLSGGIDSGSITAVAAAELPRLKTFTCGFDLSSASGLELGFDERARAERMSYLFGTEQYEMVLKAGDMEHVMPRLVRHLEEPRIGQSYPNYYVAQLASKFVKVVLSGSGGDELFGGYPWRYARALASDDFEGYVDQYYAHWHRLMPNTVLHDVLQPIWPDVKHVWTRDLFRQVFPADVSRLETPEACINHSLYFEARTFLHGVLLVEDKLSMAHGLETRVPFLDNDLVDFAMRVPVRLKLANLAETVTFNENETGRKTEQYYGRTRDGKLLMRQVMARYVPAEVSEGDKQGFSAPDASWFKGESIDYVQRRLLQGRPRIYDYLDRPTVERLVHEHTSGARNRRLLIWSLLNLETWCETFL
ncbi:MAG: asparagine synthase (glutamine-hydrolyzing) [Vicinamibacterales bacterium]|nr:asparagine synthase (glutamine-hydrolyzing) [Vicinamibacterales bacterium]